MIWEVELITSPIRRYLLLTPQLMKEFGFRVDRRRNAKGYAGSSYVESEATVLKEGMTRLLEAKAEASGQKLKYVELYMPRFEETAWRRANNWCEE